MAVPSAPISTPTHKATTTRSWLFLGCLETMDRFEGNTKGKVAVFGLLDTAGLPLDVSVGNPVLVFAQKVNAFLDFDGTSAKAYSKPEDVPSWWKSEAVGGEANDV